MTMQAVGNLLCPSLYLEGSRDRLMDGDDHYVAQAFAVQKAGNIKKIHFRTNTVTVSDTLKVAIQDIGSDGEPDGVDDVSATVSSLTSNTWHTATFASALAVSMGDRKAVVISFDSYVAGNFNLRVNNVGPGIVLTEYILHDLGAGNGGRVWTHSAWGPMVGIEYDDTTFGPIPGCIAGLDAAEGFDSADDPDERGNRFSFPFPVTVAGAAFYLRNYDDNGDFDLVLYHPGGSVSHSVANRLYNGTNSKGILFFTETDIAANGEFRLAIKAQHATQIISLYARTFLSSAARSQEPFGAECKYTSRVDGGAWGETDTKQAFVYPVFSKFDDAGGGGGGFVAAGVGRLGVQES